MSIRAALTFDGTAMAPLVVRDPLLLGYVFGTIAEASDWRGASACAVDSPADLKKMGLLRLAFEEALAAPELVLDAARHLRWDSHPDFALGRRWGRIDSSAAAAPSFERLSEWLEIRRSRPFAPRGARASRLAS